MDKRKEIRLADLVSDAGILYERAQIVAEDLVQDYFNISDPNMILAFHDKARIQCDIIFDYIYQISRKLKDMNDLVGNTSPVQEKGLEVA